jgi:hypothetical protein
MAPREFLACRRKLVPTVGDLVSDRLELLDLRRQLAQRWPGRLEVIQAFLNRGGFLLGLLQDGSQCMDPLGLVFPPTDVGR